MNPFVIIQSDSAAETAVLVTSWKWLQDKYMLLLFHEDRHIQTLEGEHAYIVYKELYKHTIIPVIAEKKKEELCVF